MENIAGLGKVDLSIKWRPHERLLLLAFVSILMLLEFRAASLRPFWFDEVSTVVVSSQPTLSKMFRAVPYDGNPPLYFLLTRASLALPIRAEIAARLPALLAFNVAVLLAYIFVRRRAAPKFAFLVASFLCASDLGGNTAVDARPYALLLCFTALAACSWQSALQSRSRFLGLSGIAASMAGAILTHQYGVLYIALPIGGAMMARALAERRIDFGIIAALLVGAVPALFTVPITLRVQAPLLNAIRQSTSFEYRPGLIYLDRYVYFMGILSAPFLPLLAMIALVVGAVMIVLAKWMNPSQDSSGMHNRFSWADWMIAIVLSLFVPIMLIVTRFATGFYARRYSVGMALGISILAGARTASIARRFQWFNFIVFWLLAYSSATALFAWAYVRPDQPEAGIQRDALFATVPSNEQMVIADPIAFSATWWYTHSQMPSRVHYLSDLNYASKTVNPVPEYSLALEQQIIGAPPIEDYGEFTRSHRDFLLYVFGVQTRAEWVQSRLAQEGWTLTLTGSEGFHRLYRVSKIK